ncbi:MAG: hypothetical protein AAB912_00970 [Patescibacteria group bacterium]
MENDVMFGRMYLAGLVASALTAIGVAMGLALHHGWILSFLLATLFQIAGFAVMKREKIPSDQICVVILAVLLGMLTSYYVRAPNSFSAAFHATQPTVSWQLSAKVAAIGLLIGTIVTTAFLLWNKSRAERQKGTNA